MSKRNRKSRELSTASELCLESVEAYKARVKKAKRQLNITMALYLDEGINYDIQDELIGRAYLKVVNAKRELEYRRKSR